MDNQTTAPRTNYQVIETNADLSKLTQPVTMAMVNEYSPIASDYAEKHITRPAGVALPCPGKGIVRILPPELPERDLNNPADTRDMRTKLPDGRWVIAAGRAPSNYDKSDPECWEDFLDRTLPGNAGKEDFCGRVRPHEREHEQGFRTEEPERKATDPFPAGDLNHDLGPTLMNVYGLGKMEDVSPCLRVIYDRKKRSPRDLGYAAVADIPTLAKAEKPQKPDIRRVICGTVAKDEAICYITNINTNTSSNGLLLRFTSPRTTLNRAHFEKPIPVPSRELRKLAEEGDPLIKWLRTQKQTTAKAR